MSRHQPEASWSRHPPAPGLTGPQPLQQTPRSSRQTTALLRQTSSTSTSSLSPASGSFQESFSTSFSSPTGDPSGSFQRQASNPSATGGASTSSPAGGTPGGPPDALQRQFLDVHPSPSPRVEPSGSARRPAPNANAAGDSSRRSNPSPTSGNAAPQRHTPHAGPSGGRPDPLQGRSIRIRGDRFVDEKGRTVHFRGINLGANSKLPTRPCGYTHLRDDLPNKFFNHRDVSFVGRPFPLSEAHEHFARLQHWGYTLLRFLITWEAVEHAGPGVYDEEYLDYLYAVVKKAKEYGFWVWIDPHQDAWSRFTGGSGAPGWTLSVAGFDVRKLEATGAAVVHQTHGDPFTHMLWPTNYTKLACATMFMLFYGGKELAARTCVKGENIQEYLQRHYLAMMQRVVRRLSDLPHVIGYGVMNEPNMGWIGIDDLTTYKWELQLGPCCAPLQSLALSNGLPQLVSTFDHGAASCALLPLEGLRDTPCGWVCSGRRGMPQPRRTG